MQYKSGSRCRTFVRDLIALVRDFVADSAQKKSLYTVMIGILVCGLAPTVALITLSVRSAFFQEHCDFILTEILSDDKHPAMKRFTSHAGTPRTVIIGELIKTARLIGGAIERNSSETQLSILATTNYIVKVYDIDESPGSICPNELGKRTEFCPDSINRIWTEDSAATDVNIGLKSGDNGIVIFHRPEENSEISKKLSRRASYGLPFHVSAKNVESPKTLCPVRRRIWSDNIVKMTGRNWAFIHLAVGLLLFVVLTLAIQYLKETRSRGSESGKN